MDKQLLKEAAAEIRRLRRDNELMNAQLQVFDKMVSIFFSEPPRVGAGLMSPDVLFALEKEIGKE